MCVMYVVYGSCDLMVSCFMFINLVCYCCMRLFDFRMILYVCDVSHVFVCLNIVLYVLLDDWLGVSYVCGALSVYLYVMHAVVSFLNSLVGV